MKPVFLLVPLLAAFAALPLGAAPADTPPVLLTVNNQQKLVTVKTADGSPLFSTVMSTPNLTLNVTEPSPGSLFLTLQDGAGKTLWAKPLGTLKSGTFRATSSGTGYTIGLEKSATPNSSDAEDSLQSLLIVIGPDDKPLSVFLHSKKHTLSMLPQKDGFSMTADGKTSTLQLPGTDHAGVLTILGKEYPFHEVQRNGKTYKELDWNGQHILFPPDSHFTANLTEGSPDELIIDLPDPPALLSQNASAAPAK